MLLLISCSGDSCPLKAGSVSSQTRDLPPFNTIILHDKVNLVLTEDSGQQVRVSAGSNLLAGIQTSVDAQTLTIQDNNKCSLLRDPSEAANIYISSGSLRQITYYGAGSVTSTNTLHSPVFTVDCWMGSGTISLSLQAGLVNALVRNENANVVLSGTADSAYVYCGEAGSVNLLQLPTSRVAIDSKSIRDITVNVTDTLHANIVYKGNVYYKGSPAIIDALVTSSGKLIHLP
ncbi:MAG TPA: DUF2807 domain-containing protein [Cyclobacteriaceae bacterium]|nr:DUF2807 domain-containing protein [Cyclobacteriaceae bacterium]